MVNEQKNYAVRLEVIRGAKKRGDVARIARILEVSRTWVSLVIHGHGVSERVLLEAERLIYSRQN